MIPDHPEKRSVYAPDPCTMHCSRPRRRGRQPPAAPAAHPEQNPASSSCTPATCGACPAKAVKPSASPAAAGDETDPALLSRWHDHRLHRRIRRQRRRVRHPRVRRRPQAPHLAPRARPRPGLDPRRQAHHFHFQPRTAYSRFGEMFTVPAEGGVEEKLPFPTGYEASMSPDGALPGLRAHRPRIHHVEALPRRPDQRASGWPRLSDSTITKVPRTNSNDFNSHVGRRPRLLPLRPQRPRHALLLRPQIPKRSAKPSPTAGLDLKSACLGPDAIVYEQFGGISLYDLKYRQDQPGAHPRPGRFRRNCVAKFVNVGRRLASPAISPNGARAVFAARGEIVTVPAEKGDPRNLTNTPRRHGARTAVVARRQDHRLPLRRIRRVRAPSSSRRTAPGEVTKIDLKPGFYRSLRYSPGQQENRAGG